MSEDLINFIIEYLSYCFSNDEIFKDTKFSISEAYEYDINKDFPQIAIQLLDDIENQKYSSFEAENVSSFGIQFNIFAENMNIGEIIYNAQKSCTLIANKLKSFMNDLKFKQLNKNIVKLIRVGRDYSLPFDINSGQVYVTILRYDCETLYTYLKELENIKEI